jgi:hypothetical protein
MSRPPPFRKLTPGEWLRWYLTGTVALVLITVTGLILFPWGVLFILIGVVVVAYVMTRWVSNGR